MEKRACFVAVLLATAFAPISSASEEPPVPLKDAIPIVIAHRGASGDLPEHTLEAYSRAIDLGADYIEPDLVFTRDGILVARHDRYLSTTTDVSERPEFAARRRVDAYAAKSEGIDRADWWIEDFTLAEVKTLRARQPRNGRSKAFDDQFLVPTLDEVIAVAAASGRAVGIYPEAKHPEFFRSIGLDFETPLLDSLENFKTGPVFIQSFEPEILKRLRPATSLRLIQLIANVNGRPYPDVGMRQIAGYADGVGPSKDLVISPASISTSFIEDAHSNGLVVHVWTHRDDTTYLNLDVAVPVQIADCAAAANRPVGAVIEAAMLFSAGVDGVFADFPDTAIAGRSCVAHLNQ